jgi:NADPH:quinone reductase-like Zn-dependent oxidoreductase
MQALRLNAQGEELRLQEVPAPEAGPNEVVVAVKAAALNHRDVWIRYGQYPGLSLPCTLGSDGAGVVSAAGQGVSPDWIGQPVVIHPSSGWGDNPRVQSDAFEILGMPSDGTFATYIKVSAGLIEPMPSFLDYEHAAALPLAGLTAWRALMTRAGLQAGERLLISGIGGGVAQMGLLFATALGCEVWVTSGSDDKLARARELGAQGGVNYKQADWGRRLKEQTQPFDVIMDSAGGEGFGTLTQLVAGGGRIVYYGATQGKWPQLLPQPLFWKQISILGSTMGTHDEFRAMLQFVSQHQLQPNLDRAYSLAEGEQALQRMEQSEQFGNIVLRVD